MVESKLSPLQGGFWGRVSKAAAATVLSLTLAACGGGNGDPCGLALACSSTPSGSSGPATTPGSGSGTTATVAAADMTLVLDSATLLSGGGTVLATATVVDANRNLLANVPVTFAVDNNATAAVPSTTSDANGVSKASISAGADRANRVVMVTATSGGLIRTVAVQVTGARIVATPLPATLAPGANGVVRFRVVDVNSNGLIKQAVTVTGVGAAEVKGETDQTGTFEYAYTAPSAAGTLKLVANAAGVTLTQEIQVQVTASIAPAIASPPIEAATVSLSSAVVPANVGSTNNRVEVRALFLRETNKPAERVRVRFDLGVNPNDIPGTLSTGSSIIYSDATGIARTTFTPGTRTSPVDGVTVRACWDYTDFALNTCPNSASARLTVVSEPLSVSVGTDNKIALGTSGLDYVKRYLVQVNDAAGGPKAGVQLSALVDLKGYYMGFWELVGIDWNQRIASINGNATQCDNEDINRNSVNEVYSNGAVEDANRNGQLDPRKADVVISFEGDGKTDAAGQAVIKLTYPQSVGSWVSFSVSVIAGGTGGSEGRASFSGLLPVLDEHVTSQDRRTPPPPPAFVLSPYNPDPYRNVRPAAADQLFNNLTPLVVTNPDGLSAVLCSR